MGYLLLVGIYIVAIIISTLVFAASLFLVEDIKESSFVVDGALVTWVKCAGVVTVMDLLGLVPYGFIVSLVVFFAAAIILFHKTLGQSFLLLIVNWFFSLGVYWLIGKIVFALLT